MSDIYFLLLPLLLLPPPFPPDGLFRCSSACSIFSLLDRAELLLASASVVAASVLLGGRRAYCGAVERTGAVLAAGSVCVCCVGASSEDPSCPTSDILLKEVCVCISEETSAIDRTCMTHLLFVTVQTRVSAAERKCR